MRFATWTWSVCVESPTRPSSSVARTRTRFAPAAANVVVTSAPVASSYAPSSSRSQAYVSPRPGLSPVSLTGLPARGRAGDAQIDGAGRLASHVPFLIETRSDEQPSDS